MSRMTRISWYSALVALSLPALVDCGGSKGEPSSASTAEALCPAVASAPDTTAIDAMGVSPDVKAYLEAVLNTRLAANSLEGALTTECAAFATELGAPDTWSGQPTLDDAQYAACAAVVQQMDATLAHNPSACLQVAWQPPGCAPRADIKAECDAQCAGQAGATANAMASVCQGQVSGSCGGQCSGTCTAMIQQPSIECSGGCTGTCSGSCEVNVTGSCSGTCVGQCDGDPCNGACSGTCSGTCSAAGSGSCSGTCTGSCTGSCTITPGSVQAGCSGSCSGSCSADFALPTCYGGFGGVPSGSNQDCEANCDAAAAAAASCTKATVSVQMDGATSVDQGRVQAAVGAHLANILALLQGQATILSDVTATLPSSSPSLVGTDAGDSSAGACIAAASQVIATIGGHVSASAHAAANVSHACGGPMTPSGAGGAAAGGTVNALCFGTGQGQGWGGWGGWGASAGSVGSVGSKGSASGNASGSASVSGGVSGHFGFGGSGSSSGTNDATGSGSDAPTSGSGSVGGGCVANPNPGTGTGSGSTATAPSNPDVADAGSGAPAPWGIVGPR